tara:strand:+ start:9156 stop:9593 length:438 start_codon:yes stop_codon:yes gene_type:complete
MTERDGTKKSAPNKASSQDDVFVFRNILNIVGSSALIAYNNAVIVSRCMIKRTNTNKSMSPSVRFHLEIGSVGREHKLDSLFVSLLSERTPQHSRRAVTNAIKTTEYPSGRTPDHIFMRLGCGQFGVLTTIASTLYINPLHVNNR